MDTGQYRRSSADAPGLWSSGVAIIGMSGRFPGARDVRQFWRNVCEGVESVARFTDDELLAAGVDPGLLADPDYVRAGAVLHEAEFFDAQLFGCTAREAEIMDPQHRVFLECAWEALEDAGYDPEGYRGTIGVYAGTGASTYATANLLSNPAIARSLDLYQIALGNDKDFLPTRVAYKLGLDGPAVAVQTACSTSLVAVHVACQALLLGDCDVALAGGVSISFPQTVGYLYREGMLLSPDGHCRAFDARARGMVPGHGAGIVVLKRFEDAAADGDTIRAVIKAVAVNNDGASRAGFAAPGVDGQASVVRRAMSAAGFAPATVSYVEANGTGTELGDPIEVAALTQAFGGRAPRASCAIGSVKTNVGHLNAAAGAASLVKCVLSLQHATLPPSLHFEEPNPHMDLGDGPFFVNTELSRWTGPKPLRAGVSAFGVGGTNAHVCLEEAPAPDRTASARPAHLLILSAETPTALEAATRNLIAWFADHPERDVADVAHTLQNGRRALSFRRAALCSSWQEAVASLEALGADAATPTARRAEPPQVVFVFPGDTADVVGAGSELYRVDPRFREHVDYCAARSRLEFDPRDVLLAADATLPERAFESRAARVALFVVEYALARLWTDMGVRPAAAIGAGVGEVAAMCAAGALALDEGLSLAAEYEDPTACTQGTASLPLAAPEVPYFSTYTGSWITGEDAVDPSLTGHRIASGDFADRVARLGRMPGRVLLEVGPRRPTTPSSAEEPGLLRSLAESATGSSDYRVWLATLGRLWLSGVRITWDGLYAGERRFRVSLPTYPFERKRYWIDPSRPAGGAVHPRPAGAAAPVAPRDDVERGLVALFEELLGVDRVGIHDDFFAMGGDSLLGTRMAARIRESLGVSIPLRRLFEITTPLGLAEYVKATRWAVEAGPVVEIDGDREEIEL